MRESRPESETKQTIKSEWAQRLELPGVPNLHKVSDNLYRGAKPTAEGMRQLEKLGSKTVVNLRFLKIATDAERTPIFVHCHRGVERTGTMCATYRIVVQGWARDEAIEEMTKGGFTTRTIKKNLLDYIRKVDVTEIKHSAGLND